MRRSCASGQPESRHKGDGPHEKRERLRAGLWIEPMQRMRGPQARVRKSSLRGGGKPEAAGARKPRERFQQGGCGSCAGEAVSQIWERGGHW